MAGDWIKVEKITPDKPEIVRMATLLKTNSDEIFGKLFRIWSWADDQSVSGKAMQITGAFLDFKAGRRGFAAAMRAVGWLAGEEGNLEFPGFERHNGETAKARAETNRRVGNHRARIPVTKKALQIGDGCAENVTAKALQKPLPEKRREENIVINRLAREHEVPTVEQAVGYAASAPVPISEACAVAFWDTQQAVGWITKHGHPLADWRAGLRRYATHWNENEKGRALAAPAAASSARTVTLLAWEK